MADVTISVFWTKYIAADDLGRAEMLKTKTLIGKLHETLVATSNDDMKQFIAVSEVQSYLDNLIEYYEAKYGEK